MYVDEAFINFHIDENFSKNTVNWDILAINIFVFLYTITLIDQINDHKIYRLKLQHAVNGEIGDPQQTLAQWNNECE